MKAYMSTESSRHQYFEDGNGPHAVLEARAILAETEHGSEQITDTPYTTVRWSATGALAESLAAFVEDK